MKIHIGVICKCSEKQRDCSLRIDGRGRLTSLSVEYKMVAVEMSFTRRPGSRRPRQSSRRENRHIVRNARLQPTASSAAIQAQWCHARGNWTAVEWNQVVFSDVCESRFNFSSDDNRARVQRPRLAFTSRLNPAFTLQRHTTPTAGVMVWGAIVYNTRPPILLIHGTMTAQRYVHDILQPHVLPLMQQLPGAIFKQDNTVTILSPHNYYLSLACPTPRFVTNRAYGIIWDGELGIPRV
ncbi:transposable element Tcb2 transposase [Trichonephila clavipes]|nr:transposable element Tcb2 transposase [Trichonephila clavipes]